MSRGPRNLGGMLAPADIACARRPSGNPFVLSPACGGPLFFYVFKIATIISTDSRAEIMIDDLSRAVHNTV